MYFVVNDSLRVYLGSFDSLKEACETANDFDSTGEDRIVVGPADNLLTINELSEATINAILQENEIEPMNDRFENLEILSFLFGAS